jgi:hypothetical protein
MKPGKTIGWLIIAGAIGVIIPYTTLTVIYDYPGVLRQDAGEILSKFHSGGTRLVWTWLAFAILGIFLIPAYILLGKKLADTSSLAKVATHFGIIGLVAQMIGLLRWVFVVPLLADLYTNSTDDATRSAAVVAFKTIHQFGGVLLGEHVGQLFTIIWTVLMAVCFAKLKLFPRWVIITGFVSAFIYFLAQAELLATVIPGFPVWDLAGVIGSTLWLTWLVIIGIGFIRVKDRLQILNPKSIT